MKIALTCPSYWPYVRRGGRFVNGLARYLCKRGNDVRIITSKPGLRDRERRNDGFTVEYKREYHSPLFSARHPYYTFSWRCFRSLFQQRADIDIVQSLFYIDAFSASVNRFITGKKHIFYVVNGEPFHWKGWINKFMFESAIRSSVIVSISVYLREALKRRYGIDSEIIPTGTDTGYFRPDSLQKDFSQVRVLFMADLLDARKRVTLLIKAFEKFKSSVPNAVLQLSGRTNAKASEFFLKLASPRIRGDIQILGVGKERDIPLLYSHATMTVLPSEREPFGMVLVESLAAGTPVVGTRDGGIPEIISDPGVGVLFEGEGEKAGEALCRAMLDCLDLAKDPSTPLRCTNHSKRYDWSVIGPEFERVYRDVTGYQTWS